MALKSMITKGKVFKKGAEAHLSCGTFLGREAIFKERKEKKYRHPQLDEQLRRSRTIREVKALTTAIEHGIKVPSIYGIDLGATLIILERIKGPMLSQMIHSDHPMVYPALENFGEATGRFHSCGLVHGDLTTYNVIWEEDKELITLFDFGLADFSRETEQRATDLFTLLTTLKGIQPKNFRGLFNQFLEGYKTTASFFEEVKKQVEEIALRGRYISKEARKKEKMEYSSQS